MWQPKALILQNFMSFLDQEFEFINGIPVLIQGFNYSDEGQEANGSGKSAIQEAMYRGIVGTCIRRGIRDKHLIRDNCTEATIQQMWYNTISDETLIVERCIHQTKAEVLTITINDEDQKQHFATVKDGNRFLLEEVFCLTKNDIDTSFIVNEEKYISFFFSSDTAKKDLIGRFSNAEIINGVDDYVKDDVKELKSGLSDLEKSQIATQAKKELIEQQIDMESDETFEADRKERIQDLNDLIGDYEGDKVDALEKITNNKKHIKELNVIIEKYEKDIEKLSSVVEDKKLKELNKKLPQVEKVTKDIQDELDEYDDILTEYREIQANLETDLLGTVQCPKCEHLFFAGNPESDVDKTEQNLEDTLKSIEEVTTDLDTSKDDLAEVKGIAKDLDDNISKVNKKIREIDSKELEITRQLTQKRAQINTYETRNGALEKNIKIFESSITSSEERIKSVEAETNDSKVDDLEAQIKGYDDELVQLEIDIQRKNDEIYDVNQWIINFKQFYSYLANKSLSLIQNKTNYYLNEMRSNLRIKIEGFKTLASGEIRETITPIIYKNGLIKGPFGKLSGGERVRVEVANLISRQEIINQSSRKGGLDLIFIDEILDQSDRLGIDLLMKSLENINKTIIVITQLQSDFQHNKVRVTKRNDISKIEYYGK